MKKLVNMLLGLALMLALLVPAIGVCAEEIELPGKDGPTSDEELLWEFDCCLFERGGYNSFYYDLYDPVDEAEQRSLYETVRKGLLLWNIKTSDSEDLFENGIIPEDKRTALDYDYVGDFSKSEVADVIEFMLLDCVYLHWTMKQVEITAIDGGFNIKIVLDESFCSEEAFYLTNIYGILDMELEFAFLNHSMDEWVNTIFDDLDELGIYSGMEEVLGEYYDEYGESESRPIYPERRYIDPESDDYNTVLMLNKDYALGMYSMLHSLFDVISDDKADALNDSVSYEDYSDAKSSLGLAKIYSWLLSRQNIKNYIARGTYQGKTRYWNVICFGGNAWAQCDIALDDLGGYDYFADAIYSYANFGIPAEQFNAAGKHVPKDLITTTIFETAAYSDYTFAGFNDSFADTTLTAETVDSFVETAVASQIDEYIFFLTDAESAALLRSKLELDASATVATDYEWDGRKYYETRYRSGKFDLPVSKLVTKIDYHVSEYVSTPEPHLERGGIFTRYWGSIMMERIPLLLLPNRRNVTSNG